MDVFFLALVSVRVYIVWTFEALNNLVKIKKEKRTSAYWRQCVDLPYNNIHYAINTHHHSKWSFRSSPQIETSLSLTHCTAVHHWAVVSVLYGAHSSISICCVRVRIYIYYIAIIIRKKREEHKIRTSVTNLSPNHVYHYFYGLNIFDIYCFV